MSGPRAACSSPEEEFGYGYLEALKRVFGSRCR